MFDPVDPKQSFPDLERGILEYWREQDMFRRSVALRDGCEEFSFYDGPPFATGLPHYGHLLAGTIKDVIPRYQTMRGKKVQRRFGWDCHGLPIENLIEKEHGIESKRDIEAMGIAKFNELCRGSVQRYAKEWRATVERTGRWVDMDWDYKTMDPQYMESIWWTLKSLSEKGLLYEGHKPMHICPRCVTPLSNFEVTQGYKDVTDQSAVVQFRLTDEPDTYLLAWTTTPWTLPGNLFVAVHPDVTYVKIEHNKRTFIIAEKRVESIFNEKEYTQKGVAFSGKSIGGLQYQPLFPYFADEYGATAFRVVTGDFVTTDDGTGLVHIAPGFGEDDFRIGQREGVPLLQHVSMDGTFVPAVTDFAGEDVKPAKDPAKTDRSIIQWLEKHGKLFSSESYRHSYPHCWRCDSPLLNYATSSWFVSVEKIKEDMLQANAQTSWVPAHLRDGRFGKWLENARDWVISRNRYWGTPIPVWRSDDGKTIDVIGGRDDLMNRQLIRFTKVTGVRHGEAEHNVGHFYQSAVPGVDLTATGKKQAKEAGKFLAEQNVSVIYCSPLARTRQTAEAIARETGARVVVDERLREVDVGKYEGTAFDMSNLALRALRRKEKLQSGSPESIYHLEGMEKWSSMQLRVGEFLDDILPRHRSEHVVVVTHADIVMSMRHYFTQEDPFKLSHTPQPAFASPEQFYWDHDRGAAMDLHREYIDNIWWPDTAATDVADITFVRHGETDWNKENKMQGGDADRPLNDTGRTQALETAKKLKKKKFDVVVSSDLKRAEETATIIAKELALTFGGTHTLLRERHAGTWSGRTREDLLQEFPDTDRNANFAFHYASPPDGESLSAFMNRMRECYQSLQKEYAGKRVLVVGHRGVIQAFQAIADNLAYPEASVAGIGNGDTVEVQLYPAMKRVPQVLDCWFESGSMPYAQQNFPFRFNQKPETSKPVNRKSPEGFPADFIAEGIDQTRGWFYTLTVLSSALYAKPPFRTCVVNGTVLAEDGRKMSKKLKNYPDPTEVVEKYGADALRFSLMSSPAVRAEDIRFSEKSVEETLRSVLLPLWNSYSFFVTYAKLANFEPVAKARSSNHPLDRWIKAEVQDLVNRMTEELDGYDLSATCAELHETIDALTNWYIRLSRRRFAGKGPSDDVPEAEPENFEEDRQQALVTLYESLVTICQLLAPFCPFITESIYLNLVPEENGSIHLTDWPQTRPLKKEEQALLQKTRLLRLIVSLGLKIRSEHTIKIRQPLSTATVALPSGMMTGEAFSDEEIQLLRQELNVKEIVFIGDPGSLGEAIAMVDARKVGPRLGGRVQEIIKAGKSGEFEVQPDGTVLIQDESLSPDEVSIVYKGRDGQNIAGEGGVVVSMDTTITDALKTEGAARDVIRFVQSLRKEAGLSLHDKISLSIGGADDIVAEHGPFIAQQTNAVLGASTGAPQQTVIQGKTITISFHTL